MPPQPSPRAPYARKIPGARETDPLRSSQASGQGLGEALSAMKKQRDRSQKRRSTKAGSGFKQKQKLSQDGKGGRSANS